MPSNIAKAQFLVFQLNDLMGKYVSACSALGIGPGDSLSGRALQLHHQIIEVQYEAYQLFPSLGYQLICDSTGYHAIPLVGYTEK